MQKPEFLYHFTKTETALNWILPLEPNLRMNNIGSMNDPKENLLFVTDIDNSIIHPLDRKGITRQSYVISEFIREESKVLCFSVDKKIENKDILGYQLQRMWSQYGANNSGICIVLNYEKFVSENTEKISSLGIIDNDVKYKHKNFFNIPDPKSGVLKGGKRNTRTLYERWKEEYRNNNDKFILERFFSKNIDWEGESEYRFLTFTENEDINLSISNSIEKIILGLNFSKHHLSKLENYIKKDKIFYLDMGFNEQFYIEKLYKN